MKPENNLPLVAILRGITPGEIILHAQALYEEGFRNIEIPTNSPDWQQSVKLCVDSMGDKANIGAGTILNESMVKIVADMGGKIIVTPNFNPAVVISAKSCGLKIYCGCFSASEAFSAIDCGADVLKIFPADSFGPAYVKALKSVLPHEFPLYAVGGIHPDNLREYLSAGYEGAGLGSSLYTPGQSVEHTRNKAQKFINAYHQFAGSQIPSEKGN